MSILKADGFGFENNGALPGWFAVGPNSMGVANSGPYGANRWIAQYAQQIYTPSTVVWHNLHLYLINAGPQSATYILRDNNNADQLYFGIDVNTRPTIYRAPGTFLAISPLAPLPVGAWLFLQIRALIDSVAGNVQVWVNGVQHINFTGNTQSTGLAHTARWMIQTHLIDNVIVYDETGAAPTARTPETRVYMSGPTSAGVSGFLPVGAVANWQCVGENPADGDVTYVSAAAAPADDTYTYPAQVPAGAMVYAVGTEFDARKDDAGNNSVDGLITSGVTTVAAGAPVALSAQYQRVQALWNNDPATALPWGVTAANAALVGQRRTL